MRTALRAHRDAKGNDRCHENDVGLYKLLPEPLSADYSNEMPPACEFMAKCAEYMEGQRKSGEMWLSVKYDVNLTNYIKAFFDYSKGAIIEEIDVRVKFHLLTREQKEFVAALGLYVDDVGAV